MGTKSYPRSGSVSCSRLFPVALPGVALLPEVGALPKAALPVMVAPKEHALYYFAKHFALALCWWASWRSELNSWGQAISCRCCLPGIIKLVAKFLD